MKNITYTIALLLTFTPLLAEANTFNDIVVGGSAQLDESLVHILSTKTNTEDARRILQGNVLTLSPGSQSLTDFRNLYIHTDVDNANVRKVSGFTSDVYHNSAGTLDDGFGTVNQVWSWGAGDITIARGALNAAHNKGTGNFFSAYGASNYVGNYNPAGVGITAGYGAYNRIGNESTGEITTAYGALNEVLNNTTGKISTAYGASYYIGNASSTGEITTAKSLSVGLHNAGTIQDWYGLHITPISGTAPTGNRYGVYVEDVGSNYFAGNIGIGTVNPSERLSILNAGDEKTRLLVENNLTNANGQAQFQAKSDSANFYQLAHGSGITIDRWGTGGLANWNEILAFEGDGLAIGTFGADPVYVGTNSTNALTIDSSQNVGIGTDAPVSKFQISDSDGVSTNASSRSILVSNGPNHRFAIGATQFGTDASIKFESFNTYDLALAPGGSEALRIQNGTGNIGVNTQTPQRKLSVDGAIYSEECQLVDGSTVTFNLQGCNQGVVTLGGNRTIDFVSEAQAPGQTVRLVLCQDATGSRTVSWDSAVRWSGGTAPTLTSTPGKCDVFAGFVTQGTGAPIIILGAVLDF